MAKHSFPKTVRCGRCKGYGFVPGCTQHWVCCPKCLGSGRFLEKDLSVLDDSLSVQLLRASLNDMHRRYKLVAKDYEEYRKRFPDPEAGDPHKGGGKYKRGD